MIADQLSSFLFKLARSQFAGQAVGWGFAHASRLLPVERLYETDNIIAFRHPKPAYAVHILIVPKQEIANLLALDTENSHLIADVFKTAQHLVRELGLEEKGYRLLVNDGSYQDIGQLHFHLISGSTVK